MKDLMNDAQTGAGGADDRRPSAAQGSTTDAGPPIPDAPNAPADSPFGRASTSGRRALRWVLYLAVPLAALAAVFLLRGESSRPAAGEHAHGAVAAPEGGQPVALSADEANRIGVTYTTVTAGPLTKEVRTVGQVTFDETRVKAISPKIDGWVERLYVDFTGQSVTAGAPLLEVHSPMLVTAQEELLLAKRLVGDVAAGTPDAVRSADELLRSARRRLAYWDIPEREIAEIERTGEVRRTLTLRAPVGGVVVEKLVLSGQRIMAGETLYRVADLSVVWVEGEVFEQDLAAVRTGLSVTAEFESFPGERWSGRITYIYPTLNPDTRTARVRVELPNPGRRLKPGMYATFLFTSPRRDDALSVPRSAVLSTGERSLVFVRREDGRLEPRTVRVGSAAGDRVEVLAGLTAGETIVASATFLIDAESNLGTALGGMGNMPGMDMTSPTPAPPPVRPPKATTPTPQTPPPSGEDHSAHQR
jgi:Cu(I)/Ag(I) efflux system membrane fusion protein